MTLDNIRLLVTKFEETFRFYRDTLGLEVTYGAPGDVYASFRVGEHGTVALFDRALMADAVGTEGLPPDAPGQDRFAVVLMVDDLDETYASVQERGGAFLREPIAQPAWGIRVAHLRDPEGNLVELCEPMQK